MSEACGKLPLQLRAHREVKHPVLIFVRNLQVYWEHKEIFFLTPLLLALSVL